MTTKHTPKPCEKVYDTAGITRGIRGRHGPEIVNVINWNGISRSTSVTGQANANLIVAAPDLLDALKRCKFDSLNMTLEDREFCRAAIAKATGEQL